MSSSCPNCRRQAFCPRCSLFEVVRFRFGAFRHKFGRDPGPDEPLFFDPEQELPEKACLDEIRGQINTVAAAMGVRVGPVLRLMDLDSGHSEAPRVAQTDAKSQGRSQRTSWQMFVHDKRLHRAHKISATELEMLSQVAFMGKARASSDFLYILDKIREAKRQ